VNGVEYVPDLDGLGAGQILLLGSRDHYVAALDKGGDFTSEWVRQTGSTSRSYTDIVYLNTTSTGPLLFGVGTIDDPGIDTFANGYYEFSVERSGGDLVFGSFDDPGGNAYDTADLSDSVVDGFVFDRDVTNGNPNLLFARSGRSGLWSTSAYVDTPAGVGSVQPVWTWE
jgi:hypothetical protein